MSLFEVFNFLIEDLPKVIGEKLGVSPDEIREVFQEYMEEKAALLKKATISKGTVKEEKPKKVEQEKPKKVEEKKTKKEGMNLKKKKDLKGLIVNETGLVYDMVKKHFYGKLDEENFNKENPEKSVMPLSQKDIEYCLEKDLKYLIVEDTSVEEDFQKIESLLEENKNNKDMLINVDTFRIVPAKDARNEKMYISKIFNICGSEESVNLYEVAHVNDDEIEPKKKNLKQEESDSDSDSEKDVCDKAEKEAKDMTISITEKEFKAYTECIAKGTSSQKVDQIKRTTGLTLIQQKYIQEHEKELKKLYKIK